MQRLLQNLSISKTSFKDQKQHTFKKTTDDKSRR